MRIPYVAADVAEPQEIVDAMRKRRGGTLLNLDRMLLHSPPLARGWNAFLGEVRSNLQVSPRLRELAMCVVAVLNGADYEFGHHAPLYIAEGASAAQADGLRTIDMMAPPPDLYDASERATIRLSAAMTKTVAVPDPVFNAAREALGDERALVELIGVIAAYNMVSRFLVATGVGPEEKA